MRFLLERKSASFDCADLVRPRSSEDLYKGIAIAFALRRVLILGALARGRSFSSAFRAVGALCQPSSVLIWRLPGARIGGRAWIQGCARNPTVVGRSRPADASILARAGFVVELRRLDVSRALAGSGTRRHCTSG